MPNSDQELPGMWESADLSRGETDTVQSIPKTTTVSVRERPALFSSPHWQDKDLSEKTEKWRDQRKKYSTWQIDVWGDEGSEIIGLMYGGVPTHYAFYLKDILDNPRVLDGIHFDAGTSRTELYIEPEEWKRVLQELDIMSGDSSV
jgi:hypothetical protein